MSSICNWSWKFSSEQWTNSARYALRRGAELSPVGLGSTYFPWLCPTHPGDSQFQVGRSHPAKGDISVLLGFLLGKQETGNNIIKAGPKQKAKTTKKAAKLNVLVNLNKSELVLLVHRDGLEGKDLLLFIFFSLVKLSCHHTHVSEEVSVSQTHFRLVIWAQKGDEDDGLHSDTVGSSQDPAVRQDGPSAEMRAPDLQGNLRKQQDESLIGVGF